MAMIELVDYNEIYNADKPKKKTTRRSHRGSKTKSETDSKYSIFRKKNKC